MADITVKVLQPATSIDLATLEEVKTMIAVDLTNTQEDVQLQMCLTQYSDIIASTIALFAGFEVVLRHWNICLFGCS
jgi:hypothetical protein